MHSSFDRHLPGDGTFGVFLRLGDPGNRFHGVIVLHQLLHRLSPGEISDEHAQLGQMIQRISHREQSGQKQRASSESCNASACQVFFNRRQQLVSANDGLVAHFPLSTAIQQIRRTSNSSIGGLGGAGLNGSSPSSLTFFASSSDAATPVSARYTRAVRALSALPTAPRLTRSPDRFRS